MTSTNAGGQSPGNVCGLLEHPMTAIPQSVVHLGRGADTLSAGG
ncbi:MAG TPA: hypothetical protein VJU86_06175 [Pyrinomonadaceae bacterium]|nr:hypothetical protein [Pyrinomonadaceae bacterium]